ncbi:MAG: phosphatase PAP2 family protein [Pelagibacterium sp.]|uniref:phosphatase PAP2 family protein n=1 Tax=Pelagibacterium sp. TaxID=1967288 RepID=UPI0032EF2371
MLAPETFTAQWFKAIMERHRQAKVLFWWPLWTIIGLLVLAVMLDGPVTEALRNWPSGERAFFRFITDLGKSDWLLVPTLVAGLACAAALRLRLSYSWAWAARGIVAISGYIFASIAISGLVTVVIKRIIGRARPMYLEDLGVLHFQPFDLLDWSFHSFPSGHATTAVAFALVLRTLTNRRFHGWLIAFGFAIGLSRIVVGDHYLSDVIAGSFVGLASAIVVRDYFATRRWGMQVEGGHVRYRMFAAFKPLLRWLRRRHIPAVFK